MSATKLQGASVFLLICRDLQDSVSLQEERPRAGDAPMRRSECTGSYCPPNNRGGSIMRPAPLPPAFLATGASRTRLSRAQASSRQGATMSSVALSQPAPSNPVHSPYTELKRRIQAPGLMRKHPRYHTLSLVTHPPLL